MNPKQSWLLASAMALLAVSFSGCSSKPSDKTAPVIAVLGDSSLEVAYAFPYTDAGATASDDKDGSVPVVRTGTVDTLTPGQYTITYTAVDAAGNQATATRVVVVEPRQYRLELSSFGSATFTASDGTILVCNGGGDLCSANFDAGSQVTITANVSSGWAFQSWSECNAVNGAACQIDMNSDKLVLSTATRNSPVTVKSDVVALTNTQIAAIRNYSADDNSLIFQAGINLSTIHVGSVIVAGGGANNSIYFMKRVVNILTLQGAPTVVETIPASLDDVIAEGTLIFKLDQPLETQKRGSNPARHAKGESTPQPVEAAVPVPVFSIAQSGGVSVTASGSVGVSLSPQLAVDFTLLDGLRQVRLSASSTVSAEFGVAVTGEGSVSASARVDLPSINAGSFTTLIPVGPIVVPINFVLELEPFVEGEADGSFKASINPSVRAEVTGMLGSQWHMASGWSSLSSLTLSGQVSLGTQLESEVGLEIAGGVEAGIELYDVVGPKFTGRAYGGLRANATPLDDRGCTLALRTYGGLSGTVGGEIEILSRTFSIEADPVTTERTYALTPSGCDKEDPVGPASVTATAAGPSEIEVSWSAATDDVGISHYEIWREGGDRAGDPFLLAETATLQYLDNALSDKTEYCYYVLAVDGVGSHSAMPTNRACATTSEEDVTPPSVPVITLAEALSSSSIYVEWSASTDDQEVAGYTVINASAQYPSPFRIAETSALEHIVSRLKPDTEYCFRVAAFDKAGNESALSNRICVTTKSSAESAWSIFLGCQNREFIIQEMLDLDETLSSRIQVTGSGFDYPGTPLTYFLTGTYSAQTAQLSADIFWNFANSTATRQDRFTANIGTGDSGIVPMTQVQVTGCNAQIRIVRNAVVGKRSVPLSLRPPALPVNDGGAALFELR